MILIIDNMCADALLSSLPVQRYNPKQLDNLTDGEVKLGSTTKNCILIWAGRSEQTMLIMHNWCILPLAALTKNTPVTQTLKRL